MCGDKPSYWILYPTDRRSGMHGWFWLFSDVYLKTHNRFSKTERHRGDDEHFPTLDDIKIVVCGTNTIRHQFRKGDPTFHSVIEQIRRFEHEW
jgi:uncharacterized membrane protein